MLDKAQFDDVADGIGLSIGATALRAVAVGRSAVTRSPVLTLYPHRPAEVGVPSENPNLTERGLIITDFVDRVGDPVPIVAGDGSSHRAEALLADALRSLLLALTGGRPPTEPVGVTYPAHWRPSAVDALRRSVEGREITSDAVAALTALQDDPGVPTRGIIAVCDIGGTGASITLADAANGFAPIGPTVRHPDFSGDLIDQALLSRVVGDLAAAGSVDLSSTSAIGNLSRLRGQCRAAKERLSTSAVTSLAVELPGHATEVRVTRAELDEAIREPLDGFLLVLQDTLQRSGIRPHDLVAVAAVGGGARIPVLATSLSEQLRVPVITSPQPELAAAIGGGLAGARGLVPDGATAMAPAAVAPVPLPPVDQAAPQSSTFRALAWSDADDIPEPAPADPEPYDPEPYDPRPQLAFADRDDPGDAAPAPVPWYRRPAGMVAIGAVAVLLAVGGVALFALRKDESPTSSTTPTTSSPSTTGPVTSEAPQPSQEAPPAATQAPDQTVYEQPPPPVTETVTEPPPVTEAPPPTSEAPPPSTTTEPPPTVTVTEPPPSSTTQQPIIPTLPYQTIPGLPFVPAPIQPPSP
ncbi:MAG: hypothetical protein QOJ95_3557 [Mycobacterium sp.]|nr:hypothetical protein [Mycobacterium sp.]